MWNAETIMNLNMHASRPCMHFEIILNFKPPVARKLAVRHASFACLTASFLAMVVSSNYFTKFHDFSMIIQAFSNSMIFPCMELFFLVFQVFHDFQSLWEPCNKVHSCKIVSEIICYHFFLHGCDFSLFFLWRKKSIMTW